MPIDPAAVLAVLVVTDDPSAVAPLTGRLRDRRDLALASLAPDHVAALGRAALEAIDCIVSYCSTRASLETWREEIEAQSGIPAHVLLAGPEAFAAALSTVPPGQIVLSLDSATGISSDAFAEILRHASHQRSEMVAARQASEDAMAAVDRFRDLAETAIDRHWFTDPDLMFTRVDRISESPWPSMAAVVGRTVRESLDLVGGDARMADMVDLMERRQPFRDLVFRRAMPGERAQSIRVSGRPVFAEDGRFLGYRGTAIDVTAEVEARHQALRAQIRLNEAIETMPAAFLLFDADNRLVLWNTQALDVFRAERAAFTAGALYHHILPPEFSAPDHALAGATPGPAATAGRPRDVRNKDGRWLRIVEHQTNEGGIVCVVSDVTELKTREDEARSARDVAEQANIAKTRFLAAASHDLRQPLHAFGLLLTSLARRVHDAEAKSLIGRMEQSLESLQGMFNALLDMSRLDAGVMMPEIREFSLDALLRSLDNDFSPIAREKGIELRIRLTGRRVRSDPLLLERILRNLASNALRYTPAGRVFIGGRVRGERLRIEVRDSGIGIAQSDLDEIFREFHRLGKSIRESRIGLGLGLSIVERLAKLLGHRLDVRSEVGRGSTFAVEVPLSDRSFQPDAEGESTGDQADSLLGVQVALLDDEPLALEGMIQILSDWGCEIHAAGSADQLLAGLKAEDGRLGMDPDLMIVDFALGHQETGLAAAESAYRQLGRPVPTLIVTGSTDPESLDDIRKSGHPLLTKPVTPAQLHAAIVRAVASGDPGAGT